jgi:hypothetical protein
LRSGLATHCAALSAPLRFGRDTLVIAGHCRDRDEMELRR